MRRSFSAVRRSRFSPLEHMERQHIRVGFLEPLHANHVQRLFFAQSYAGGVRPRLRRAASRASTYSLMALRTPCVRSSVSSSFLASQSRRSTKIGGMRAHTTRERRAGLAVGFLLRYSHGTFWAPQYVYGVNFMADSQRGHAATDGTALVRPWAAASRQPHWRYRRVQRHRVRSRCCNRA